jgi:hypothetical protein
VKNQTANASNQQQIQTNTSSNSNQENEEISTKNSSNNGVNNQTANTSNQQQNQTNTSSNSNQEIEENSTENSGNNVVKNQTANASNQQQIQTNTSSNSNQEIEENSTEKSSNNVAKNQTANASNKQQNQTNSSSNSNQEIEENSTENSSNNVAKNQSANASNQNQTNTSSNSNEENEENSTENSSNNVAKNQTANTSIQKQIETNTSSNLNQENEENSTGNSSNNVAKNQTANASNKQQNQTNSSSNSNQENEENSTENSSNNVAKNQTANASNKQQNQTNSSSNSNQENEENSTENSSNNVVKNQSEYIPKIQNDFTQVKNEELIEARSEFISSKNSRIEELKKKNPAISLQSTDLLKFEKSKIENQLSSTEKEIQELKVEQNNQKKKKESEKIESSIEEKEQQIVLLTNEKSKLEEQIKKQEKEEIILNLDKKTDFIDEQKSKEILSSNSYKEYVKTITQFEKEKDNYIEITRKLETQQNNLNELINIQVLSKDKRIGTVEIETLITEIEGTQKLQETSYTKLKELKKVVEQFQQDNPTNLNEMKVLASNRKEPLTKIEVVQDDVLNSGGFEINATPNATSTENKSIPLNVKAPSGLIYRVQVGAFRKPLQNNVYSQFTPVSGELQQNGLTVYMAGYFNSSSNAINARKQIQSLGYSDAFIVAYCNGKKLTLGEARQLEAKGECVPLGDNEFLVEISKNTQEAVQVQNSNLSTTNSSIINTKSLFFTVQIGVYNKPIDEKEKFPGLSEISSSISPKKQIRYATGKFSDLANAKTRKNEAVAAGISDAFVVAYYQGERITIAQATELLAKNDALLYADKQQINTSNNNDSVRYVENETKLFQEINPEVKIEKINYEVNSIFEEFPIEKLAYFNQYGFFQFDKESGKLRSTEFSRRIDLADELKLSGLVTELKVNENEDKRNKTILEELNGDLIDVLLRTNWVNSIKNSQEISLILNSNFSTSEKYTNLLKNTFELKIESYDKK